MKRLILLRHGLTPWNAERRFQGQGGVGLHPDGHDQAREAAGFLASYDPAVVWSSDLERTRETTGYVAEATGLTPVFDERLREIHVGAFTGMTYPEVVEAYGAGPWEFADHDGESEKQVGVRMADALTDLVASLDPDATAIVVSHGAAIRLGTVQFLGWPFELVASLGTLDNCAWVELTEQTGGWFTASPWRLSAFNRTAGAGTGR